MSKKKRKQTSNSKLFTLILILIAFLYGTFFDQINETFGLMYEDAYDNINTTISNKKESFNNSKETLKVYYIDVGQADAIMIENENEFMVIDGGNNNDGPLLVKYYQSLGITDFKYVIGTHPHEDHIGGLDDIIDNFNVGTIYIPDAITTTQTFEDLLDAIERKNMTYEVPNIDNTFTLGDATLKIIYTGTNTTDLNNTSIVLKMTYGKDTFLFTGDATDTTEKKILNKDIEAEVLKVGHHGSKYSSTTEFLKKVNPKYAIISVGKNNNYGHPAINTISKLNKLNIETHRTDEEGTIIIESNGNGIKISSEQTNTNGG